MSTTQRLVLDLPSEVYANLERAAELQRRSIEDEAVQMLSRLVPEDDQLSPRTRVALVSLAGLDDASLWKAARRRAAPRSVGLWRRLLAKREHEPLSDEDERVLDKLEAQFAEVTLIRAEAALRLKERGYDISSLGSAR